MSSEVGRFDDFYNNLFMSGEFIKTKANFTLDPISIVIYKMFSIPSINFADILFLTLTSFFLSFNLSKLSSCFLFAVLVFVSYPYQFNIARGNNEIILVGLAAIIYLNLRDKKFKKSAYSAATLMMIKPYPYYLFSFSGAPKKFYRNLVRFLIPFTLV